MNVGESGHHDLRFETARIIISGDMAVEIGRYTSTMSQANGTITSQRGRVLASVETTGVVVDRGGLLEQ